MKKFCLLVVASTLLAGCAGGARPFFGVSIETYSYGKRTPYNEVVPKEEWRVYGPLGCIVCGSGVQSNGTESVSGTRVGPHGKVERFQERFR